MNLTESGLGIGVASPQTALDVAGEVHVGNSGIACSAAVAGAMRYNATNHAMNYCNGTAWVGFAPSSVNVPLNACNGHYCWPDPSSLTATHLCQLAGYSSMLTYNATFEAGNYWYWNGASYAQHDGSCTSSCSAITSVMCQ
ncbi:MAG TPA: hypothetical protein VFR09_06340 [Alphaproteobacteria bacterium]|nr:hypothetical protein [Alphaproteobacteria bacterium]